MKEEKGWPDVLPFFESCSFSSFLFLARGFYIYVRCREGAGGAGEIEDKRKRKHFKKPHARGGRWGQGPERKTGGRTLLRIVPKDTFADSPTMAEVTMEGKA